MKKMPRKLLALLLAAALVLSCSPLIQAEGTAVTEPETTVTEETTVPTEETAVPTEETTEPTEETTAPTVETEPEATEEPTEEPSEEPSEEPTEEPTEDPEKAMEETEPEETEEEPVELPYGFPGLPEDFQLSQSALEEKRVLTDMEVLEDLAEMTAGTDYEADTMTIHAETREEAELYAAAYGAELVDYFEGTGLIRLTTATVMEAVEAARDMDLPLPAANPNYICALDPNE